MHSLLTLAAVLAAAPDDAKYPPGPDKSGTVRIALSVSPARPPVPAGRWNVYPEYRDLKPGNRVQGLMKTFAEQHYFFHDKQRQEQRDKWLAMPLADLPTDVREKAGVNTGMMYDTYTRFLGFADNAARYTRIEWNEYFDLRKDSIQYLLPEVQQMRTIAAALSLRLRGEVKAGEWPRAVETAKTLFGMAQALEQHPTLIGNLVAIAIFQIGLNGLEELVGQANSPSLYWGLTDVPAVPVSTRYGLGGERVFVSAQFADLLEARRPLTDAELAKHLKVVADIVKVLEKVEREANPQYGRLAADPKGWFARVAADPARLAAAKRRAVDRGQPAAAVDAMPSAQLGLLDDIYAFEELRDDLFRWYNLPHWQAVPGMAAASESIAGSKDRYVLGPLFAPALFKVKGAETRMAQRVALLRAVEAVRLHVGKTGELPTSLADTGLPEPIDPVTGKSFTYTVKDGAATLHGENPHSKENRFVVEYTIRVRK